MKHGVSMMAKEIVEEIKNLNGFCVKKFKADYYTEGLDYSQLKPGQILELEGRKVLVTKVGKPCFDDCPMEVKPCILNRNVAFGEYADKPAGPADEAEK